MSDWTGFIKCGSPSMKTQEALKKWVGLSGEFH